MRCFAVLALLAFTRRAVADKEFLVLKPAEGGTPPQRMLYAYLQEQARKFFDARRQEVAALKTPADVKARQDRLRAKFIEALGGFPAKTPLNARTVGRLQGDGFHIEKVIYESQPEHHVTATLYLPDGKGPFPGVLVPCGHSANGKEAEPYQRACILMAKNGLVVLCYDPIGQGERSQILDAKGRPALAGSTSEHTMVGVGALLVGRSTATYRIWDGIRSLDYLASRPEVDAKRLGCTGNSGGGTLTAYLMALDERIEAAAPSCYITSLERLFATIGPQDAEQNITGQVAFGMEHADYITMRAPRPTLVCCATQDFFDIQGVWTSFREASRIYALLGHGERAAIFEYNDKHGFSKPRRQAAMRWMRRWLLHQDDAPVEGKFEVFKSLQCTRSGQVLEDFKGASVPDFTRRQARALAEERARTLPGRKRDEILADVRRLIGLKETPGPVKFRTAGRIERKKYVINRTVFDTEPGIQVPALDFIPGELRKGAPLVLYLHGEGKGSDAAAGGPIEKLVEAGNRVVALDLRGLGETAPARPGKGRPNYFGAEWKEAFLGLHLSRPLLGQRVHDVLAVVATLQPEAPNGFHVIGIESAGPVALHAAALDGRIGRLTLERALTSWSDVAATAITHNQLANVVPGALKVYDLPELAGLVAPQPLTIRGARNAAGREVAQEDLDKAYAPCRAAYERHKTAERLTLQAAP
jgi:cephalosporin-C deacetylase-like acetyl esterase